MTDNTRIIWLQGACESLDRSLSQNRLAHALLLTGPEGSGKRALANWMAARFLGKADAGSLPAWPVKKLVHPDLVWIAPEEGKRRISVDQIRGLVDDLALKSHAGGGKAAVIEPAGAMTLNAANSLLKTLEEPPGHALLILVADSMVRLPATILSRCASVRVALPAPTEALDWLAAAGDADASGATLALAGGAPLKALRLAEQGLAELAESFGRDLGAIVDGSLAPLDAAARWSGKDARFAMEWLEGQVAILIRRRVAGEGTGGRGPVPESVLRRMDSQDLFCYLDRLTGLRNQPVGSFNEQLALESLLIPWSRGLGGVSKEADAAWLGFR